MVNTVTDRVTTAHSQPRRRLCHQPVSSMLAGWLRA
jgi:hypothetical protein